MKPIDVPDVVYISTYGSYEPWTEKKEDETDVCYLKADTLINEINRNLKSIQEVEHLSSFEIEKAWNRGYARAKEEMLEFIQEITEKGNTYFDLKRKGNKK